MYKYATLKGRLVRAGSVYSEEELKARHIKPSDKLVEGGKPLVMEQAWTQNPDSLLTASTLTELLSISNKAVGIVHGLCVPPLITIDIDYNADKVRRFRELVNMLPDSEKPLVYSESVDKEGLHLTYHYSQNIMTNYVYNINKGGLGDQVDILSSTGKMLFIGNKGNLTKKLLYQAQDEVTFRPVPQIIQYAVISLFKDTLNHHTLNPARESGIYLPQHTQQPSQLGYMFKGFVPTDSKAGLVINKFLAQRLPLDLKKNFEAPEGEAYPYQPQYYVGTPHDLLLRLSGSLKNDPGVDQQQHKTILEAINDKLPHSKQYEDLQNQIIKPDQQGDFIYREDWENMAAAVQNIHSQLLNIYTISKSSSSKFTYLVHNTEDDDVRLFSVKNEVVTELNAETTVPRKVLGNIVDKSSLVLLINRPEKPFGLILPEENKTKRTAEFNLYRRELNQQVFYNKQLPLGRQYTYPAVTIAAIESQMGKEKTHELFLPFLKHKLITKEPTPLIFALMGVPHSFKTGLLEGVVKPLFSSSRFLKTNGEILTEKYNDYLINKDILFLDEIHHLEGTALLKPVIQALNKFGSEFLEGIRAMYSSVSNEVDYHQEITPFITMNKVIVPASETVGERRLVVGWGRKRVSDALELSDEAIKHSIKMEQLDFAYYLATEVGPIAYNDYHRNDRWKTIDADYYSFMEEGIPPLKKFALMIGATYEVPKIAKLKEMFPNLRQSVVKLGKPSHGSVYRIRLWNAQDSSYRNMVKIPGLLDSQDEIDYNDVPKALAMNEKVLVPSMVSDQIKCRKQDLVVDLELLLEYDLVQSDGEPYPLLEEMRY